MKNIKELSVIELKRYIVGLDRKDKKGGDANGNSETSCSIRKRKR